MTFIKTEKGNIMNRLIITAFASISFFGITTYSHAYTVAEFWEIKSGCISQGKKIGIYPDGTLACYASGPDAVGEAAGIKPASEAGASTMRKKLAPAQKSMKIGPIKGESLSK